VHKFEQSICDVKRLQPPDDDWRARDRTEEGVQVIFDSMTQFGNLTGNIWAVATSRLFYVAAKALRDDPTNEKLQVTYNEHLRTVVLQVVSGDHTTAAYQRKNRMYPLAECWQTAQFQLLICEGTPDDIKFLYEFGSMMNMMQTVFTKQDFVDSVVRMHNMRLRHEEMTTDGRQLTMLRKELLQAMQQVHKSEEGYSIHTLNHMWSLTKIRGPTWDVLEQVLLGNIASIDQTDQAHSSKKRKRQEGPSRVGSMNVISKWAMLPQRSQLRLIQSVLYGHLPLSHLPSKSKIQLGRIRIRIMVLSHAVTIGFIEQATLDEEEEEEEQEDDEDEPEGWWKLVEKFPEVESWLVDTWGAQMGDMTAKKVPVGWQIALSQAFHTKRMEEEVELAPPTIIHMFLFQYTLHLLGSRELQCSGVGGAAYHYPADVRSFHRLDHWRENRQAA